MVDVGIGDKAGAMQQEGVFHVAVVGGGLAGISAARVLSSRFGKENVVILEAAACLGGRIRNVQGLAPWPVEIGAEFIHGSEGSSVKDIADEMGCVLRELNFPDYYYLGPERRLLSTEEAEKHADIQLVHKIFANLSEDVSNVPPEMSMAEYLSMKGVNPTVMQLAQAIYGNDYGCSLDKLGVHECIWETQHWTYGDTYLILDRPFLSVVGYMSKDLNVRLNWALNKVERLANNRVQLHSQDGRIVTADNVILTVPLTLLQHDFISFNPPLPDWKLKAAHAIGMSNVVKVILAFCHPFWPKGLFDVVCGGCFLPEVWITEYPGLEDTHIEKAGHKGRQQPLGQHVVVGFIAGTAANALSEMPEGEVFKRSLAQLDDMFGASGGCGVPSSDTLEENQDCLELKSADHHFSPRSPEVKGSDVFFTKSDLREYNSSNSEAPSGRNKPASFHFQGGLIVNWAEAGFIRGGYSHPSVNAQGAREALAKPVGRIFFAGEATHPDVNPCLQAAIDTGQRAARQVIGASNIESRL